MKADPFDQVNASVTIEILEKAQKLRANGEPVVDLSAGQLPFLPPAGLISKIVENTSELSSFQYSPSLGNRALREKVLENFYSERKVSKSSKFDCAVTNGAKSAISSLSRLILSPGDKVILLAPFWTSYSAIVKMMGAEPLYCSCEWGFTPNFEMLESLLKKHSPKLVIVNSPNNPSGVVYSSEVMREIGDLLTRFPQTYLVSDEIYFDINSTKQKPTYFYEFFPSLLDRTFIVDGISKNLSSTGLRIGYLMYPERFRIGLNKLVGHFFSGPNSLIQKSVLALERGEVRNFLVGVNQKISKNREGLKKLIKKYHFEPLLYESNGAFYYILEYGKIDQSMRPSREVALDILAKTKIATVPLDDFGLSRSLRISLTLPEDVFMKAVDELLKYFS